MSAKCGDDDNDNVGEPTETVSAQLRNEHARLVSDRQSFRVPQLRQIGRARRDTGHQPSDLVVEYHDANDAQPVAARRDAAHTNRASPLLEFPESRGRTIPSGQWRRHTLPVPVVLRESRRAVARRHAASIYGVREPAVARVREFSDENGARSVTITEHVSLQGWKAAHVRCHVTVKRIAMRRISLPIDTTHSRLQHCGVSIGFRKGTSQLRFVQERGWHTCAVRQLD